MAMLSDILSLSKTVVRMSPYIMERRELLESRALRAKSDLPVLFLLSVSSSVKTAYITG